MSSFVVVWLARAPKDVMGTSAHSQDCNRVSRRSRHSLLKPTSLSKPLCSCEETSSVSFYQGGFGASWRNHKCVILSRPNSLHLRLRAGRLNEMPAALRFQSRQFFCSAVRAFSLRKTRSKSVELVTARLQMLLPVQSMVWPLKAINQKWRPAQCVTKRSTSEVS